MPEVTHRTPLSRNIHYSLPLDQQLYSTIANRFNSDLRRIADIHFTNPNGDKEIVQVRSERVLWLSQFLIEQSQNDIDGQEFTTNDILDMGFPATTSADPLNQLHKRLPFFIHFGIVKPSEGRRFRKYEIVNGFDASLKYVESRF